jgi:phosphoribosylaminoimidazole-succinocarboxamide synthase
LEPDRFDKDIIRTWIREQCDPYTAMELPKVTDELIETTSKRYIEFYERLTGETYVYGFPSNSVAESAAISKFFRINYP